MAALLTLVFLGFGLQAQAQTMMPLPTYGTTYSGSVRGYWFTAPTAFTITGVRVPTDVGTTAQSIQILKFTAGPPPAYASSTTAYNTLGLWIDVASTTIIPCNINIAAGDIIGILGTRATSMCSYASTSGPFASTILGMPVTLTRLLWQGTTYPVGAVSEEATGQLSRVEMYYTSTVTGPNDAGISSIDSPVNFCAGVQPVKVTLQNFGTNRLLSATINWKLNNVTQPPYSWTGMLDTVNLATRQTQVTLATQNFASGTPYNIVAWTTMPNGVVDTITKNDTSSVLTQAAISGTFTIGGASPDFANIASAVNALNQFGLCGPAVFNIRSGNYNEQFSLGAIPGSSAVNTVTFQSQTGNRGDVNITSGAATGTTNNYVVQLKGADYIRFKNLTFTATNVTYGTVCDIQAGAENNVFENIDFIGVVTATTSTYLATVYSPSGSLDHNNTFLGCNIRNGSYGMMMYGSGTTATENNLRVENCEFTGQYYMPIYFYYEGQLKFFGNKVVQNYGYTYKYAGYMMYGYNTQIERNTFITDGGTYCYGMYLYYDNYYQAGSSRVVNNFYSCRNASTYAYYAAYIYYCSDLLFAHNTVILDGTYATGYAVYSYYGANQRYLNNIMKHNGAGRAWYVGSPAAIIEANYNDLYSNSPVLAYWGGDRANLLALQTASGMNMNSVSKDITFKDYTNGDLHLAAPSDDDNDLIGTLLSQVTDDIDNDPRVRPYMGADEACYLIPNSLKYEFVDGNGYPIAYATIPGTVGVHYTVIFPDFDATIQMTANFYSVPGNQLMYTQSFSAAKLAGQTLDGTSYFNIPSNMPVGFYRIELVFNTKNSCGYYRDYMPYPSSLMLIGQGSTPCEVWPGDVNNDGLVNYTDRKDLNLYIYDANLSTLWLNGPARYRADAAQNPLTYLTWQPQASVPWYTTMGCYMDADGNGVVNNFDYIAIKLNWNRSHGAIAPKHTDVFNPTTFDMTQNYPNPFNPTTQIQYSVPERTQVQLRIVDMLGREIAMPVNGLVEVGVYKVEFDGSSLPSGQYLAIVSMMGQETGLGFNKTVKMVLNK
ncbi:MAG: hypothetical protein IH600_18160 [Bacteroidetes bacterium]|nr:hypothetical protein [Bacteroidota bacterium]